MFLISPLWGDDYIISKLQENLDKTKEVVADICKLSNIQEKLVLLLQCIPGRIQHLLATVPMNLSRDFAKQHDEALFSAVAATLELGHLTDRDRLLMQRKVSRQRMHSCFCLLYPSDWFQTKKLENVCLIDVIDRMKPARKRNSRFFSMLRRPSPWLDTFLCMSSLSLSVRCPSSRVPRFFFIK